MTKNKGNAFAMLASWRSAARRGGVDAATIDAVLKDAKSGDYNHLTRVLKANGY